MQRVTNSTPYPFGVVHSTKIENFPTASEIPFRDILAPNEVTKKQRFKFRERGCTIYRHLIFLFYLISLNHSKINRTKLGNRFCKIRVVEKVVPPRNRLGSTEALHRIGSQLSHPDSRYHELCDWPLQN